MKTKLLFLTSLLCLLSFWTNAQELPIDLIKRANTSQFIFEGKVIQQNSYYTSRNNMYTSNIILISKILKGEIICGTIELITEGGIVGNKSSKSHHLLNLNTGDEGVFLCSTTSKELPNQDYYQENNLQKIDATFEKQSFITYWWNGTGYSAADLWQNFDNLAEAYNAFELISGLTFTDCVNNSLLLEATQNIDNEPIALASAAPVTITSIHPLTLAGGIKDTLFIRGYNFGSIKGEVYFKDADTGGLSEVFTTSQMLWTDTLITVIVPSYSKYTYNNQLYNGDAAGSGTIRVNRLPVVNPPSPASSDVSSQTLHIKYSIINSSAYDPYRITPKSIFNQKFTFHCTESVSNYQNGLMKKVIKKSLNDWICLTGVNWELGADISDTSTVQSNNDICVIGFTGASSNILAFAKPWSQICNLVPQITECDISIDSTQNWLCDTTSATIPMNTPRYIDFYSVFLHELGHCLALNHTIDIHEIMNYAIDTNNFIFRNIDLSNDISCDEGANWVFDNQLNYNNIPAVCGTTVMSSNPNPPCSQFDLYEYGNKDFEYNIFPNPFSNSITIEMELPTEIDILITLYDLQGRRYYDRIVKTENGFNIFSIENLELDRGVYFLNVKTINNEINFTHKIIKE